jgi:hypothetical protein
LQEDSIYLLSSMTLLPYPAGNRLEKLDLVGMDACLMSQLEVYTAYSLRPLRGGLRRDRTRPRLGLCRLPG